MSEFPTRRAFLGLLPALAVLGPGAIPGSGIGRVRQATAPCCPMGGTSTARIGGHPEPRKGIDASHVLRADQILDFPEAAPVFDAVREMPAIVDGIRCACGCAGIPGYYSLLSCFEGDGMAQACRICQGQAKLAHRLFRENRSLDEIRTAIDVRFG